ncbi:MAG: sulfite exporter TauE/SafE family protein [Eggerthellaceae bacterium]|nr:sulfite exporter TauE/SafE family protein [Eggerthellaceae bacterium]
MIGILAAAALVGVAIGMLSGMLGIGGGLVMVPVFRLAFGLSPVGATATSLFTIVPTSISGALSHMRNKTCLPKLGLAMGIGGACTSSIGVWLAQISPGWLVMAAAALVICYSGFTMFRKALSAPRENAADGASSQGRAGNPDGLPESAGEQPAPSFSPAQLVQAGLIGAAAGLASGYVGLGGGFIMVPLMLSITKLPMKLTSGTSLIAVLILATPAAITQCVLGNVDYVVGIATACGTIPGAVLGARLVRMIPERTLRFAFAFFLVVAAILLVVKELGFLG